MSEIMSICRYLAHVESFIHAETSQGIGIMENCISEICRSQGSSVSKVIIHKSRGEVSLVEQDTIEYVS